MKKNTKESGFDYLLEEFLACESKDDFVLTFFMFWTDSVTITDREFQKVITNRAINNWFLAELEKQEKLYFDFIAQYPHLIGPPKDQLYITYVYKLMSVFPKVLLAEAKKKPHPSPPQKGESVKIDFFIHQN